ncbi:MAG: hypothetical protein VYA55_04130 [Pseudomonadota bacterium]|nr:hypothetical protein [Pseudomonadota bacterium]
MFDYSKNLFDASRNGHPTVRSEDLLALRFEFVNLHVSGGDIPLLSKADGGDGYLIVHFPPQTITEQAFFETKPQNTTDPDETSAEASGQVQALRPPPVRARIADESRLVFKVPDNFSVPYQLDRILEAIESLTLSVSPCALPAPVEVEVGLASSLNVSLVVPALNQPFRSSRALRDRWLRSRRDFSTLNRSMTREPLQRAVTAPGLWEDFDWSLVTKGGLPAPAAPKSHETAIEMPWRLLVSPSRKGRWLHARRPLTSPAGWTELWHTRLTGPGGKPFVPDPQRIIRAIWARTGEGSGVAMGSAWPSVGVGTLPGKVNLPFRSPLTDADRFQISHLTANFKRSNYTPSPVEVHNMMLSSLGAWLDSRGAWELEGTGLDVEEWVHRGSMGRDHYVKVVYRGFLCPLGHRVSLVKVTERKFHTGAKDAKGNLVIEKAPGNTAYLRQRFYLVRRERDRYFQGPEVELLKDNNDTRKLIYQWPFSKVGLLTEVTPNLDDPGSAPSSVASYGQDMFWPSVDGKRLMFQCSATDLDGRIVTFELPMIFVSNTLVAPFKQGPGSRVPRPDYELAETVATELAQRYQETIQFDQQKVALADSMKAGDTAVDVRSMVFAVEAEKQNATLRAYSDDLNQPLFFPKVSQVRGLVPAMAGLAGGASDSTFTWNSHYLWHGFNAANKGQVFVDVGSNAATMDFSAQGDRSGGFIQPNLQPKALSRLAGPVMSDVEAFAAGTMAAGAGFGSINTAGLPLPLLFGTIPLAEVIGAANIESQLAAVPKFISEAGTQLETFFNGLAHAHQTLASLPATIGGTALAKLGLPTGGLLSTLADLGTQSLVLPNTQQTVVSSGLQTLQALIMSLQTPLNDLADLSWSSGNVNALVDNVATLATGGLNQLAGVKGTLSTPIAGVSLPSGLQQNLLNTINQLQNHSQQLASLPTRFSAAQMLQAALSTFVDAPNINALLDDPGMLTDSINGLQTAIQDFQSAFAGLALLQGTVGSSINSALQSILDTVASLGDIAELVELLTGDELTIRFDWTPELSSYPANDPIFRANDVHGLVVAIEARVKKNNASDAKIQVSCSLNNFDLVLIAPASFIELNFDRIEFLINQNAKMDVDVQLADIKFVGPLSFVESLRSLIPLDGFSDPPYLDITSNGIDAGYDISLPNIAVGVLNISNISLGAGFTVPFVGQPVSVRFNFCRREQPFLLTVSLFGGGGFFGLTIDPSGVQIFEAAFEFGASLSVDLGVASGNVTVMAGLYYRIEQSEASLTGYFRLGGSVDVLGLITASIELYLELYYEMQSGKCKGKAQLTIEVEVLLFSGSVTITCERKFAGSNGDPSLRQMLGLDASLPLEQELDAITEATQYGWRDYMQAFA